MDGDYIRTYKCRRNRKNSADSVKLEYNGTTNKARYGNLMLCGSVWLCSLCSDLIHRGRREDLMRANQLMEEEHYIVMFTLTLSHNPLHTLHQSRKALRGAFTALRKPTRWKKFKVKLGYIFDVAAMEVTFGFSNGWHPHLHVLCYLKKSVVDQLIETDPEIPFATFRGIHAAQYMLEKYLVNEWLEQLEIAGFSASAERGVDVQISDRKISEYVTKFGHLPRSWGVEDEVTRSNSKKGRSFDKSKRYSPMQLLMEYAVNGSEWAGDKWLEYALEMQGKNQLRYSQNFKKYLKANGIDILTDQQLAETEENYGDYGLLGALTDEEWQRLMDNGLRGVLIDYTQSVEGDGDLVKQFLVDNGVLNHESSLYK